MKSGRKKWATRSSSRSTPLTCSHASLRSLAHSLARLLTRSLPSSWNSGIFLSDFQSVLILESLLLQSAKATVGPSPRKACLCSPSRRFCFSRLERNRERWDRNATKTIAKTQGYSVVTYQVQVTKWYLILIQLKGINSDCRMVIGMSFPS